jgi:general secretion pathway protein H
MVALVIIGIMVAGVGLSVNLASRKNPLEQERTRLGAIIDYLRDQAALQSREYGIRCFEGGYEFLVYDVRNNAWLRLEDDSLTRTRELPAGIDMTVLVEGRPIVLPAAEVKDEERKPQILLFSSGEMNLFELQLRIPGLKGVSIKPAAASDQIEIMELAANPA